jgi:hypothetical protein
MNRCGVFDDYNFSDELDDYDLGDYLMHDDFHDDLYLDEENDESFDFIPTSQSSPLRIPDDIKSSTQRANLLHDDWDSKRRRRRFHQPGWKRKLRELSWWGKRSGEWAKDKIVRKLNWVISCPPNMIESLFNDLETNSRYDYEKWADFGWRYGRLLGAANLPNSLRGYSLWNAEILKMSCMEIANRKRKDLLDYKASLRRGLVKYKTDYEALISQLRRALESTEKQERVMNERREKRIKTLKDFHGKTPRHRKNQRVIPDDTDFQPEENSEGDCDDE